MRLALISDIHEDVVNLQKTLRAIELEHCNEIICLGDIVGFSELYYQHGNTRNASECIRLVKENCTWIVPGNHDYHAAKRIPYSNRGFVYPNNWYDLNEQEQDETGGSLVWLYNDGELDAGLSDDEIDWLRGLPESLSVSIDNKPILLTHYIFPNTTGAFRSYAAKRKEFEQHKEFMKNQEALYSFCGHCHYSGMVIASRRVKYRQFNRTSKLKEFDSVLIPSIVKSNYESGFCIFDTNRLSVTAKRI
ncbi:MAG: metallophosphoesterase family protein [Bacteroidales bacterium]|nr:metallophosphoesterase family protein [Bacteroidales bacterium]